MNMGTTEFVILISLFMQIAAAVLALWMMCRTGDRFSWGLLATAMTLMSLRRSVDISHMLTGQPVAAASLLFEVLGLVISLCMLAGIALLAQRHGELQGSAESLRRDQRPLEQMNLVLGAIRKVNQNLVHARTRDDLLKNVCKCLVETGSYTHAAIALTDGSRPPGPVVGASHNASSSVWWDSMSDLCKMPCIQDIVARPGVVLLDSDSPLCACCSVCSHFPDGQALGMRLFQNDVTYGVMVATLPPGQDPDWQQQSLFVETARDVAFALHGTRLAEERASAEQSLRLDEARLEAVLHLSQMTGSSLHDITDFALEQAVHLTGSTIGYLAFMSEDESLLTMHSWSRSAMAECRIIDKPIVYPLETTGLWGEAVRQRRAVVTNDYQADNPCKKGYPAGHVKVDRHMNVPVFDGERIVVVAGVGNKKEPYNDSDVRQLTLLMQGMLQLLKRREAEDALRKAHELLEERVGQRTAELAAANEELRHTADELRLAMHAAEAANRAKGTFLANMSHEIRTPLNAIIGMTDLVLKSQLAQQQREFLMTVRDAGEALLSVINDILDFSKIEAGKLSLDVKPFDLWESLGDTMKSFALRAHQQDLELAFHIEPDVPHLLAGDYPRLRQVVVNLVGNAIKFTQAGEVVLNVSLEPHRNGQIALHFSVRDTGMGIPLDKQSRIFGMFEQGDTSMTRRHGGTGLGLAISSRLVDLMGGRIWVESEPGTGSTFHFTAHLEAPGDPPQRPSLSERASLHGLRVLVVDDNATNRLILHETILGWGMEPVTAGSAQEALNLMRQEACPLVLTDAHMPDMDGFSLVEAIRRDPALAGAAIMILTSGDRPEDALRCRQLNVPVYLLKPVKHSELLEAIERVMGVKEPAPAAPVIEETESTGELNILLAEDSLVNQRLAVALLEKRGHRVTSVVTGRQAVDAVETGQFDLVLMDVQMPEMDGLEATRAIRSLEKETGRHLPVIAMTAHALEGHRRLCLDAGMDSYVSKPIRADELFRTIGTVIPRFDSPRLPASEPAVDWDLALRSVEGDGDLLDTLIEAAQQDIPRMMKDVRDALTGGDVARLQAAAHSLKGSLGYFGDVPALRGIRELERRALAGNLESANELLDVLERDVDALTQAIQERGKARACHFGA
jgi:signal transduction histidine kinase/DNA-binding response OmpR family regulator